MSKTALNAMVTQFFCKIDQFNTLSKKQVKQILMVLNFNSVGNIQACMATLICMLKYADFLILRDIKGAQRIYKVFT